MGAQSSPVIIKQLQLYIILLLLLIVNIVIDILYLIRSMNYFYTIICAVSAASLFSPLVNHIASSVYLYFILDIFLFVCIYFLFFIILIKIFITGFKYIYIHILRIIKTNVTFISCPKIDRHIFQVT